MQEAGEKSMTTRLILEGRVVDKIRRAKEKMNSLLFKQFD